MFKSCFPNSQLGGSPSDPVPPIASNPLRGEGSGSEHHTVANAKGIYLALRDTFATRPDVLFVVVTAPPLVAGETDTTAAANARAFNDWLVKEWLAGYAGRNVLVFDFFNVLTSSGGCTRTGTVTVTSGGGAESFVAVIPAVAHSPGALGSLWRTDVAAVNHGPSSASLTLTFVPVDGTATTRTAALGAGGTHAWTDVLSSLFGVASTASASGALRVSSDRPLCLSSRTFNQGTTGTFGGFLPAVTAAEALSPGRIGVLPQLSRNALFRTNVGVANLGTSSVTATIRLYGESGAAAGNPAIRPPPVRAYSRRLFYQIGRPLSGMRARPEATGASFSTTSSSPAAGSRRGSPSARTASVSKRGARSSSRTASSTTTGETVSTSIRATRRGTWRGSS